MTTPMVVSRVALSAAVVAGVLALGTTRSEAATLGFSCITNNSASSCAIGQSQLSAELTDLGNGSVEFTFANTGAGAAALTQIYFDQPGQSLLSLQSFTGSNGVGFQPTGSNSNLLRAAGVGSVPQGGVNPGQWLKLVFTLNQGSTFASLLTSLSTGDLRIGTLVQSIGAHGNSETFLAQPATVVPEPASMLLLGTGLAAAAAARRRRRQAAAQPQQ